MLTFLAVTFGKIARFLIRLVRPGGGSALPGVIAGAIQPKLLKSAIDRVPLGLVVVSGSAGKSSTTSYLVALLQAHGLKVFTNTSTANIRQGLVSAVLSECDFTGKIDYDIAVLEWDEGHGAALVSELSPRLAVLTNVYSDQLDRFVDPDLVIKMLTTIGNHANSVLINAEDNNLTQIDFNSKVICFGAEPDAFPASEFTYALNFGSVVKPAANVQAGIEQVLVKANGVSKTFATKNLGSHQALNLAAAVAAVYELIEPRDDLVQGVLSNLKPVFARNEEVELQGRNLTLRLVQNPTSFQKNLNELLGNESPLMLMAGRDIHDPSWLWTVDFSGLNKVDIVGGYNAADLALRLKFQNIPVGKVVSDATEAADQFMEVAGPNPTVLFSADAMRRVRRHWGLAK